MTLDDRDPETDLTPAAWLVAGVRPFRDNCVMSLVPAGFEAYVRVFHPARAADGARVTWAEVARANGRVAHPAMEWVAITGDWRFLHDDPQPGVWQTSPEEGSLPPREAAALAESLSACTTSTRWWYALWNGFGALPERWQLAPRIPLPARDMYLFAGDVSYVVQSFNRPGIWHQSANVWWPDDRAWCVATDIDLMTSYVGGRRDAVAALLARGDLETAEVPPDQKLAWDTDQLNPLPPPPSY